MDEPCQSGNFCFNSSKISRAVMDNALEMRTVVYVIYRGLYEDGGSLENHAVGSHDAIGKCIAILGPLVHISVEFSPRTSRPNQRFPASLKMPSLCATGDAIIGRRQWETPMMHKEIKQMFDSRTSKGFIEKVRKRTLKTVSGLLKDIKRAEKHRWMLPLRIDSSMAQHSQNRALRKRRHPLQIAQHQAFVVAKKLLTESFGSNDQLDRLLYLITLSTPSHYPRPMCRLHLRNGSKRFSTWGELVLIRRIRQTLSSIMKILTMRIRSEYFEVLLHQSATNVLLIYYPSLKVQRPRNGARKLTMIIWSTSVYKQFAILY